MKSLKLSPKQESELRIIIYRNDHSSHEVKRAQAIILLDKEIDIPAIEDKKKKNPKELLTKKQRREIIAAVSGKKPGGCSKAYSSLAAFVGCSQEMSDFIKAFSTPYDLSGPCPIASLATLLQGLKINKKRGEKYRSKLWNLTKRAINGLRSQGYTVINKTGFPILSIHIGNTAKLIKTANMLFDEGILVTVAPYPMMKKGEEVHRISLTAANTEKEVDQLISAFGKIKKKIEILK